MILEYRALKASSVHVLQKSGFILTVKLSGFEKVPFISILLRLPSRIELL